MKQKKDNETWSDEQPIIVEVCADSVESAVLAERAGANRLELCSNLIIGGTSPTPALFRAVRQQVSLPIHVLVRPRFGDFCYSEAEFNVIKDEVSYYAGVADGLVIGLLLPDGQLDIERLASLIEVGLTNRRLAVLESPLHWTLHRAFDMSQNSEIALQQAIDLGFDTVLTSGQASNVIEGSRCLAKLVSQAGNQLTVMPGGGVNASTINHLMRQTKARAYHLSAKKELASPMIYRRSQVSMGLANLSEYSLWRTDETEVRKVVEQVKQQKILKE